MNRYSTRVTLITVLGVSLIFTILSTKSDAMSQQQGRIVVRKPWRVEPVRIVAVKTKHKANIEIGKYSMKMTIGSTASRSPSPTTTIRPSLR